ncbi:Small RNA 2'-O-methyltransferase [Mortierella alpina]|uniref:Small RNA 2'-O-methyltransferase n=1 Tax=Mortierella alpina TaxID=64518 RepID=A0A9P6ITT1_MORAP|nr:Small RNA 2'-O-methyltransferase [Mortierella alpina]
MGDYPITRLAGVDISQDRLELAANDCHPQEFELGQNVRVNNLTIELYQGSVAESDSRLMGYDALACLEVVEHLDPEVLEKFWSVVLGVYKPKVVIVSTPNAEFNVYFSQLKYGTPDAIMRNDDHRFEWTRQEFEQWCTAAAEEYGYSTSFTGVGILPSSDVAVGHCTQFAILKDNHPDQPAPSEPQRSCYTLCSKIEYPVYLETHTEEENRAFLQDKIARIRPLPPRPAVVEDDYASYGYNGYNEDRTARDQERENENEGDGGGVQATPEPEIELGVLALDDIWSDLTVRQRLKTKSRMIGMLDQMPLFKVDLDLERITFDEEDPFWKEADERYDRLFFRGPTLDGDLDGHGSNSSNSSRGEDDDQSMDGYQGVDDRDGEHEPECVDENDRQISQWDSGADIAGDFVGDYTWEQSGRGALAEAEDGHSPWNSPVYEPPSPWNG